MIVEMLHSNAILRAFVTILTSTEFYERYILYTGGPYEALISLFWLNFLKNFEKNGERDTPNSKIFQMRFLLLLGLPCTI